MSTNFKILTDRILCFGCEMTPVNELHSGAIDLNAKVQQ